MRLGYTRPTPYALRTIVELVTDEGISGISEIPGNSDIDAALAQSTDLLVGLDVFQLNQIQQRLTDRFGTESAAERGLTP